MAKREFGGQVFTVRPDRVDFRDFPYRAPLRSLPRVYPDLDEFEKHVQIYIGDDMVLQQGRYGACTGFGLASVINYLKWEGARLRFQEREHRLFGTVDERKWKQERPKKVSESMLYLNARLYDEWAGDDYEGSSCRGAMKGWHKHGVCTSGTWPYKRRRKKDGPGQPQSPAWREEATQTVLGAYYRIDEKSIVDMQAAIHEIHAIYVAADAHDGWTRLKSTPIWSNAVIQPPKNEHDLGGHAFAMVGYTEHGFIVQNSWGTKWGYHGFALLPYTDWVKYGYDAWALALGAPIASNVIAGDIATKKEPKKKIAPTLSPIGFSTLSLQERVRAPAGWSLIGSGRKEKPDLPDDVEQWTDDDVTHHVIVSTIDGAPVRQMPVARSAEESVRLVARAAIGEARNRGCENVAIVIHGGLNSKDDGLVRAGFMGPWFLANKIVPIFPIWQTDGSTSLLHALIEALNLDDLAKWLLSRGPSTKPDDNKIDRAVEDLARRSPGKGAWSEMKNKAEGLSRKTGALGILIDEIANASKPPAIHLIGHSAGAIVAGHALNSLQKSGLQTNSVSLYAPACTTDFANATFAKHLADGGYLKRSKFHIDYLSDRREQMDPCLRKFGQTFYSKSLLYLVSRAFESEHKTPILGMERALKHDRSRIEKDDAFSKALIKGVENWQAAMSTAGVTLKAWDQDAVTVTVDPKRKAVTQDNIHGAFDNNLDCVNETIKRILGASKVPVPITDLNYGGG